MRRPSVRAATLGLLALLLAVSGAACSVGGGSGRSIVVYNAQHEQLLTEIAPAFTKATGIKVELRNGEDSALAAQLVKEGSRSPADVFLTENSPAMAQVERAGLFTKLDAATLARIPQQYRPTSGLWTGFVARSTVLVYNTDEISDSQLPASLMDLADPAWAGKVSFSPTGADFQAIVAAVLHLKGEAATQAWLAGLKRNGTVYDGNNVVLQSVNAGKVPVGIVYHYYWYRDRAENGDNSNHSKLHFFTGADPGAFLSVSGAGVLKASKHQRDAQRFVSFLTSRQGQTDLAKSYALEYPLNPAVTLTQQSVMPFDRLQPPAVAVSDLDGQAVVRLLTQAGFL